MQIRIAFFFILFGCWSGYLRAQDRLVLVPSLDTLFVQVKEIGSNQIFYYNWNEREQQNLLNIDKNKVISLLMEDGAVIYLPGLKLINNFVGIYPKSAFKIDPIYSFYGCTHFAFEHMYKPRRSYELGIGILGLGFNKDIGGYKKGFMLRASYKHYLVSKSYNKRSLPPQLKGWYYRLDLSFNRYLQEEYFYERSYVYFNQQGGLTFYASKYEQVYLRTGAVTVMNFGRQFLIKKRVCLDIFLGFGIGIGAEKLLKDEHRFYEVKNFGEGQNDYTFKDYNLGAGFGFNHSAGLSLASQVGIKIGYCFDWRKGTK